MYAIRSYYDRIYSKIVDTVDGNSMADTGLLKSGVVNTGSGEVTVSYNFV